MTSKYKYNHTVHDKKDERDHMFTALDFQVTLPPSTDLRTKPYFPPVLDQGQIGSCTCNATASSVYFCLGKENIEQWFPSRLFLYYNTRVLIEHTDPSEDSGAAVRDVAKSISRYHMCREEWWPYDISKFADTPDAVAYEKAAIHEQFQYQRVDNTDINQIKTAIAKGYPVIFGMSVFESFESDETLKTGIVTMPTATEKCLGGHALLLVGFNDETQMFTVLNSWGPDVMDKGFCYIPYAYLTDSNLADGFWVLKFVS